MARLTKPLIKKIDRPGTIGDLERLAGIEPDKRADFWRKHYVYSHNFVPDGCSELREIIKRRVVKNEICLI